MKLHKYKLIDVATCEISNIDKKTKSGEQSVRLCNFTDVYYNWTVTEAMSKKFMVATASESQIGKLSLKKGQVAITKDSETRHDIGIPCYIADTLKDCVLGYHCALITPNPELLDGRYLNAYLNSKLAKEYFANNASGSGMRYSLPIDAIKNIILYLPDIETQRAVGKIFSNIDRKIALNREINRNLEAMARQLYDYWFVQFDFPDENGRPYKSSGGKMVWNEKLKRDIPYRWSFTSFDKICQVNRGASPRPINAFMDETHKGMPWLKISDATSCDSPFIHVIKEHIIDQGINKSVTVLPETLIVSNSATPGIPKYMGIKACVHDGWLVLTKYSEVLKYYLYFVIQDLRNMLVNTASGSVFKNLKTDYLKQAPIILPPDHIISCFHDRVSCIMDTINLKTREIIELQAQRDELLPLLMNGQVSVMKQEVNCDLSHD